MSLTVKLKQFQVAKARGEKIAKVEFRGVSHFSRVLEGPGEFVAVDEMQETEGSKMMSVLLAEYEDVIHSLQKQVDEMKGEQENLKKEILELISENQTLSEKLDAAYQERIKSTIQCNYSEVFKTEIVSNLKSQLELCKKEKGKTLELYETSLKLIENLESEISNQQESFRCDETHVKSSGKNILEVKLRDAKEHLELAINRRDELESENIKYQTEIAKLKMNLESNDEIMDQMKLKQEEWKMKCFKLEQDYAMLNATYECVVQSRNDLESKLDAYSIKIQELIKKNNESRDKVEEALDLVEKALVEKEAGALRELQLKEEVGKLHMCLEHVIDEAGKRVGTEVDKINIKHESTMKEITKRVSDLKSELKKKKLQVKRISFKYRKLEKLSSAKLNREKISLIKGSETEITVLENQLSSVYEELERVKLGYENLSMEKRNLESELSELIGRHEAVIKERDSRETQFGKVVNELKSQIDEKIEDLNEASRRCEFFLNQVQELQAEKSELAKLVGNCNCDKLKAKIKKLKEVRISQMTELESHVESQMKLNEEWKKEVRELTEKLEKKIREVKDECDNLRLKNRKMASELKTAKKKIVQLENV